VILFNASICATGNFLPSKIVEFRLFNASICAIGCDAAEYMVLLRKFNGF